MVLLPDLEPYHPTLKADFVDCLGFCRRTYISLRKSPKPRHFTRYAEELVAWSRMKPLDIDAARKSYSGLGYLNLIDSNHTSEWKLLPEKGYFFRCNSARTPKPSCKVLADFDEGTYLEATFSKDYLPQIDQIVTQLRAFARDHQLPTLH